MSTAVSNVSSTATTAASSASTNPTTNLGETDFLQLLMTEMTNQDPMQPMDDTQFIAQMAQFSSLEQMQNVNTSLQMSQATSMIGSEVTWANASGQSVSGTVGSVHMVSGTPNLVMQDSQVSYSSITSGLNSTNPSTMVGTTVSWTDSSGNTQSGIVKSVSSSQSTVDVGGASIGLGQVLSVQNA